MSAAIAVRQPSRGTRRRLPALLVIAAAWSAALFVGVGATEAAPPAPTVSEGPEVGVPMPTPPGGYSYLATRGVTERVATMKMPEAVAALPVPATYRAANLAFAAQFDRATAAAVATPGACLQVVVSPQTTPGNLFDYGFFPVAEQYCPR